MDPRLPLSALLSQPLVAFTIEFDNEFEHRAPHRTKTSGLRNAPWLVSMVMWWKLLRFVPDEGIPIRELQLLTRLSAKDLRMLLARLAKWWGYVRLEPGSSEARSRTRAADGMVHPTAGGRKALEVWRPLTAVIEQRWEKRFGKNEIENLRASLRALVDRLDFEPAGSLPILGYGLFTKRQARDELVSAPREPESENTLPALLSKALLAFALKFERDSELSLAVSANVLRLVDEQGVGIADLPRMAAVSKEAIAMSVGFLQKRGYAKIEQAGGKARRKLLLLRPKGRRAKEAYHQLARTIEESWTVSLGEETLRSVRVSLEDLLGNPGAPGNPLLSGLVPYPEGWRATLPAPLGLPHYPMILHRGGFPDGS